MVMFQLFEEVLLIALNPEKGMLDGTRAVVETAAAGGLLTEIALEGNAILDEKNRVLLKNGGSIKDGKVGSTYARLAAKPLTLIKTLLTLTTYEKRPIEFSVYDQLTEIGILTKEVRQLLGLFNTERYFLQKPEVREEIISRLRIAGLNPGTSDLRTIMLLGLISRAGLARLIFSTPEINLINAGSELIYASILEGRKTDKAIEFYFQVLGAVGSAVQSYGGI
jgi:hypothetical protein